MASDDFYITSHGETINQAFILKHTKIAFFAPLGHVAYGASASEYHDPTTIGLFSSELRECADCGDASFDERIDYIQKTLGITLHVYVRGQSVPDMRLSGMDETQFAFGVFKLPITETSTIYKHIVENSTLSSTIEALPESASILVAACRNFDRKAIKNEEIGYVMAHARERSFPLTRSGGSSRSRQPRNIHEAFELARALRIRFGRVVERMTSQFDVLNGEYKRAISTRTRARYREQSLVCASFDQTNDSGIRLLFSLKHGGRVVLIVRGHCMALSLARKHGVDHELIERVIDINGTIRVGITSFSSRDIGVPNLYDVYDDRMYTMQISIADKLVGEVQFFRNDIKRVAEMESHMRFPCSLHKNVGC
jgi:hypothetical protein